MKTEELSIIFSFGYYVIMFGVLVLLIAAWWKLFEKAGEPGWAALVPFYNTYLLFKIAGRKKMFWGMLVTQILYMISAVVVTILAFFTFIVTLGLLFQPPSVVEDNEGFKIYGGMLIVFVVFCVIFLATAVVTVILRCFLVAGIARNFGHGSGFAVGLFFLPYIFYPILAFSSNTHYIPGGVIYGCPPQYGYPGGTGVPPQFVYLPPQNGYVPPQNSHMPPQNSYMPPQNGYVTLEKGDQNRLSY